MSPDKIAYEFFSKYPFLEMHLRLKFLMEEDLANLLRGEQRAASCRAIAIGYEAALKDEKWRKDCKLTKE